MQEEKDLREKRNKKPLYKACAEKRTNKNAQTAEP